MRCSWVGDDPILIKYHDEEFCVPTRDDRELFERLILESMQCGLNWRLILSKREIFRECFDEFDFEKISRYDDEKIEQILSTEGMIRSVNKIRSVVNNARCFLKIRDEFGSFSRYIWNFSDDVSLEYDHLDGIPSKNSLSEKIAADLKSRGFKYVGAVVIYSYLQSIGIINDHEKNCDRYLQLKNLYPTKKLRDNS